MAHSSSDIPFSRSLFLFPSTLLLWFSHSLTSGILLHAAFPSSWLSGIYFCPLLLVLLFLGSFSPPLSLAPTLFPPLLAFYEKPAREISDDKNDNGGDGEVVVIHKSQDDTSQ